MQLSLQIQSSNYFSDAWPIVTLARCTQIPTYLHTLFVSLLPDFLYRNLPYHVMCSFFAHNKEPYAFTCRRHTYLSLDSQWTFWSNMNCNSRIVWQTLAKLISSSKFTKWLAIQLNLCIVFGGKYLANADALFLDTKHIWTCFWIKGFIHTNHIEIECGNVTIEMAARQ